MNEQDIYDEFVQSIKYDEFVQSIKNATDVVLTDPSIRSVVDRLASVEELLAVKYPEVAEQLARIWIRPKFSFNQD